MIYVILNNKCSEYDKYSIIYKCIYYENLLWLGKGTDGELHAINLFCDNPDGNSLITEF